MDQRQMFGVGGAGLLLIGVFLPVLEWPPHTYSFLGRGSWSGISVLLLTVAAFVLALKQKYAALLTVTAITSAVVLFRFYGAWDTVSVINDAVTTLRSVGSGQQHTRPALLFGWGVLFVGIGLLFAASAGAAQEVWVRVFNARKAES